MTWTRPTRSTVFILVLALVGIIGPQRPAAQTHLPADLVLYAAEATAINGTWQRASDATAAGGVRLWQPDAAAPKVTAPSATPHDYFEVSFQAEAGRAYRLWLRGLAQGNSYNNDSVYVQFSGSVDASGAPVYRIGTTSGTTVVIEDCSGCGVSGWGWQDNEYGGAALGPAIYFATTGPQTLRIQGREDGISIDQIVLSSSAYYTTRPGAAKNDSTILPETQFSGTTGTGGGPIAFSTTNYAAGNRFDLATVADVNGDGKPDVVGFYDNSPLEFWSFTNNGDRSFTNAQFIEDVGGGMYGALTMTVDDFTRDGRKDVLFLHGTNNALVLGTGDGAGHFTFWTGGISFAERVADFASADFNRDGIPDVVTVEPDRNAAVIYKGDGTGHFSFVSFATTAAGPQRVATGDLDGDSRTDVVTTNPSSGIVTLLYGDGTGRFRSRGDLTTPSGARGAVIADVNKDGRNDLAIAHYGGVTLYLAAAAGAGWQPAREIDATQTVTGAPTGRLAVADMNADGAVDLVVGYLHGSRDTGSWHSVSVLYGDGTGAFDTADEFGTASPATLPVVDFDADGRPDVYASSRGAVMWNAPFAENHAPTGEPQATPRTTITTSQESILTLWSGASDPDGHLLRYVWKDPDGQEVGNGALLYPFRYVQKPAGTYTFTATVDDMHGATATSSITITITSDATGENHPPVAQANVSMNGVWPYEAQFQDEPDPNTYLWSASSDPDGDPLGYEWRDENGRLLSTSDGVSHALLLPGTHTITLTVRDGRGGVSQSAVGVQVLPYEEINIGMGYKEWTQGQWHETNLTDSWVVIGDTSNSAPKAAAPLASPTSYAELGFVADPTQEYKFWIRLRAENDYWGNDSVWVQFTGATDASGNPVFRTGTTSGLAVNLEECSGCGIAGWGWRDDAWGAPGIISSTVLRFPQGGVQSVRIQTREDGVTIDQVVLSARKYKTTRPGAVKNDTIRLPFTAMWGS